MMLKLRILNMNGFLKTVNACTGPVLLVSPDGKQEDIRSISGRQEELKEEFQRNRRSLKLRVSVKEPSDYFRIVNYYTGDC